MLGIRMAPVLVVVSVVAGLVPATAAQANPGPRTLFTWRGDQTGERYGFAVSQLADVNRDGAEEAVIGAPFHTDATGVVVGIVEVRSGRSGNVLFRFTGAQLDSFGYAVADAGDVDGDGVHDIVAGAPGVRVLACNSAPRTGRAYVFSGRTGAQLLMVSGAAAGDQFGAAVGAVGDLNRDGRGDILVGAPCHDGPNGVDAGAAYVVSGRDGQILRQYDGEQAGDGFGWGTAGLGDIVGNRPVDYLVGAKDAGPGDRGLAYVYSDRSGEQRAVLQGDESTFDFGWFFVATAGDVDRDGREDIYVGDFCALDPVGGCTNPRGQAYVFSGRTYQQIRLYTGVADGDGAGPGRSAGDVNRDGYDDVAVGLYSSSAGAQFGGRVQVRSGRDGAVLYDDISTIAGETLGYDVVGLGDVNRDRRADLLISGATLDVVYLKST
ncbi:hypothetical protein Rhe02_88670 [Rhizocola hellebori]|uniref:VCBS repeat-containing protein n=1 Tax=Rhizocola hellebori TaxID=1392758 RepID=A0A8J3QH57_9ACTN|nr:integrin alpha [Rhizocola hellebori]GIH10800.1 hypothetical protein Rhe02_88670 [Rhizocola hellebori]